MIGPRSGGRGRGAADSGPVLIRTKLEPPPRAGLILPRDRLLEPLVGTSAWRVLAVHAPAGYGKTEFLRQLQEALVARGTRVAWLRVDHDDNDPRRFLRYLGAALAGQGFMAADSGEWEQLVESGGSRAAFLENLCGRVSAIDVQACLIVDHCHELRAEVAWQSLEMVLRYLPAAMQVCIASRGPALPGLGRLRGDAGFRELDAGDLAFDRPETTAMLDAAGGTQIDVDTQGWLYARTRGWPCGLQIMLRMLDEPAGQAPELGSIHGGMAPIADYFRQEVYDPLPAETRRLLRWLAIPGRANAELVSAVSETDCAAAELEALAADSIFTTREEDPGWVSMHPLFAEFLAAEWQADDVDGFRAAQGRAAAWMGARDLGEAAVRHAILAGEDELALALVNRCIDDTVDRGQFETIAAWRVALPESFIQRYPLVVLLWAWELGSRNRWGDAEVLAGSVIQALQKKSRRKRQKKASTEVGRALGLRAVAALVTEDAALMAACRELRASMDADGDGETGLAAVAFAADCLAHGDRDGMQAALDRAGVHRTRLGSPFLGVLVDWLRCEAWFETGDLESALRLARLSGSSMETGPVRRLTGGVCAVTESGVLFERNAEAFAAATLEAVEKGGRPLLPRAALCTAGLLRARAAWAEVRRADAREILGALRERFGGASGEGCRLRAGCCEIRLLLRGGELDEAMRLARELGLEQVSKPAGRVFDPRYVEIAEIAARLALARGRSEDALKMIGELHILTPAWMGLRRARLTALETVAQSLAGATDKARDLARGLVREGVKVGLVRTFVDEGGVMRDVLRDLFASGAFVEAGEGLYVNRVLDAFEAESAPAHPAGGGDAAALCIEALTGREKEVLQMVADGCSNQQISEQLYLSLGTVKWHLHNIYDKLMVRNRTQAVNRARELRWM